MGSFLELDERLRSRLGPAQYLLERAVVVGSRRNETHSPGRPVVQRLEPARHRVQQEEAAFRDAIGPGEFEGLREMGVLPGFRIPLATFPVGSCPDNLPRCFAFWRVEPVLELDRAERLLFPFAIVDLLDRQSRFTIDPDLAHPECMVRQVSPGGETEHAADVKVRLVAQRLQSERPGLLVDRYADRDGEIIRGSGKTHRRALPAPAGGQVVEDLLPGKGAGRPRIETANRHERLIDIAKKSRGRPPYRDAAARPWKNHSTFGLLPARPECSLRGRK